MRSKSCSEFHGPHHSLLFTIAFKILSWDFPSGPVVKNMLCNAEDSGSSPGQGTKIPHAKKQLNPHATTTEPMSHN